MDNVQRYIENEKLAYYVLKKSFPALVADEDMIQEAKIGLWKACITFREEKGHSFSSYACKVIYNTILSVLKKNSRRIEGRSDVTMLSIHQPINPDEPESTFEDILLGQEDYEYRKAEQNDFIRQTLTAKEQSIYNMVVRGMTQCEVADVFGVSRQYISSNVIKIRKKLEKNGIRS